LAESWDEKKKEKAAMRDGEPQGLKPISKNCSIRVRGNKKIVLRGKKNTSNKRHKLLICLKRSFPEKKGWPFSKKDSPSRGTGNPLPGKKKKKFPLGGKN